MGFRGDERGQSEVIGALLIFAVIVAFIGLNQAFLVPQANEEVEFKHHNDVQRDVVDLRAATTEAAASNQPRSRAIALGTDYPSRFVAINPPPATGTIRTVDGQGEITTSHSDLDLSAVCGTNGQPDTKFIEYRPNYNEYGNALPMTIENSVVYREASSRPLYSTGQVFAKGNQINIIRYVGDVQESSASSASLDLIPSETGSDVVDTRRNESLNITLPTRLSNSSWEDLVDTSEVTPVNVSGDRVKFEFANNTVYTVRCTTVGINEEPNVSPSVFSTAAGGPGSINPAGFGSVKYNDTSSNENNVTVVLKNLDTKTRTIEEARVPFYSETKISSSSSKNSVNFVSGNAEYVDFTNDGSLDEEIGGRYVNISNISIDGGETGSITIGLYCSKSNKFEPADGDFFVLSLQFKSGDISNYFVKPEGTAPSSASRTC